MLFGVHNVFIVDPLTFGDYNQKLNIVVASGQNVDIIWTSNWLFNYPGNVGKGAFMPLDELIPKYAPDVTGTMPDYVWDGVKVDGEIYGIPS